MELEFQGYSETMGTLSMQADGDIYLGSGSAIVHFANSSGVGWASGTQLIIHDWNGSLSGGGTERVCFGSSASGLTTTQVHQVGFLNPADSCYCVVPGNTAGDVQFFNTGFDSSLSVYGVHQSGVYTSINQTNLQTWLYLFNSTASSTAYKLWVGTGTGSTINTNNTPLKTGTVSQSSQAVNSYYRTFGSHAKTLQVERVSVATNPDTALGRRAQGRAATNPTSANQPRTSQLRSGQLFQVGRSRRPAGCSGKGGSAARSPPNPASRPRRE